jgi:hypothetical protein
LQILLRRPPPPGELSLEARKAWADLMCGQPDRELAQEVIRLNESFGEEGLVRLATKT